MKSTLIAILAAANVVLSTVLLFEARARPASAVSEVFVDHMQRLQFDGHVLRADFGRSRIGVLTPGQPAPVERQTVARLVLTQDAAFALHRELGRVLYLVGQRKGAPSGTL